MTIQNVKGCIDYLPKEQKIRNYINNILRETFEEFGYLSIETPILCYLDMLSDKYDEDNDLLKEIYKLSDQGNRSLGLRYDLTVPFAKFIALNKKKINLPFKRYEINKVFRDGPIKLGRDREFTQCDVDVVGLKGQMIEAECLNLYVNAFNKLGIDIKIKYNSRNLIKGLILNNNIDEDKANSIITIVDKLDKLTKEEFIDALISKGLDNNQINNILDDFKLSLSQLVDKYYSIGNNELKLGLDELLELDKYINALGISDYCVFTPTLARGQDYYTGNVFEVYEANNKLNCSIGGGGRYDNMITNYINDGNSYPAVGISFGLSSIFELLKDNDKFNDDSNIDVYVIPMGTNEYSLKFANNLRCNRVKVLVEMNDRKIKKCFEWANKNNIPYVIVIGENEINTNIINIKNMVTGNTTECNIDDIDKIVNVVKN